MKATWKPHTIMIGLQEVNLEPGQFIFGRISAAKELKTTERKIRTLVKVLEKSQNVTIKTTNKFSIISIVKWDTYQPEENKNDQQNDQQVTNKRPASDHKQERKERKERKEEKILYLDSVFLSDSELKKLQEKYGEEKTAKAIEVLNNGIMSKGYKYKSHYHTIIGWPMKEVNGNGKSGATGNAGQTTNQAGRAKSDGHPYPVDFQC